MNIAKKDLSSYTPAFKKILSLPALLKSIREQFDKIAEPKTTVKDPEISFSNVIMSGLAVFALKYPSLLKFDNNRKNHKIKSNLSSLFGIERAPCDTQMRERLDQLPALMLRPAVIHIHKKLQQTGVINSYRHINGELLIACDGTDYFRSEKVSCSSCNVKKKSNGVIEYSHQALGCSIVHPDKKQVFPLFHEDIHKKGNETKNDCEQNAAKRLLPAIKEVYKNDKITILTDSINSKAPFVKLLISMDFNFILAAKPGDHPFLFDTFDQFIKEGRTTEFEIIRNDGTILGYRFCNDLPLNKSNQDIRINFLEHWEIPAKGSYKNKEKVFTFVTQHPLEEKTVAAVAEGGRTRSKIENETFNTLKNNGYHFEHNYGHGKKHLASVFVSLMFLMLLIDQRQEACCSVFQSAYRAAQSRTALWEKMRGLFFAFYILTWEDLYLSIANGNRAGILRPNAYYDTS
ncbi:MAG: transposase [Proteobacteria bacterium]|nr:MAG: transposase [Pseudomonadota bacterium]